MNRIISGYAALFNHADGHRDIILPSAVEKKQKLPKLLLEHKTGQEAGKILKLIINQQGVYIYAKLNNDLIAKRVNNNSLTGLSIGYRTIKSRGDMIKNIRFLEKIIIEEISLVSHPANYLCCLNLS